MAHTNIDIERKYVKMKQDVYEHLAKTFLDKNKKIPKKKKNWLLAFFLIIACLITLYSLTHIAAKKKIFQKSIYVFQDKTPLVIDYDFTLLGNAKVRVLVFNLGSIDLSGYDSLDLSVRTGEKTKLDSTIKVEIENSNLEKDAQYLSGINKGWRKFSLPLNNFKLVSEWKSIKSLAFVIEDWNISDKRGKVYIDDVRFVE